MTKRSALVLGLLLSTSAQATEIKVCFVPAQKCEPQVVAAIDNAESQILVQGYGFSDIKIIAALQNAAADPRHVDVQVILDKTNITASTGARRMVASKVPTWIDDGVTIAHNKVMIIDHKLVLTGSYNWTVSAQKHNAENLLFITDPAIATLYSNNWMSRRKVSTVYTGPSIKGK